MACAQESQNTTAFYQQWQRHLKNYGILVIAMTTLQLQNQNKQTNRNQGTPPLSGHDFKGFNGAWHGVLCKPCVRPNGSTHTTQFTSNIFESLSWYSAAASYQWLALWLERVGSKGPRNQLLWDLPPKNGGD